LPVRMYALAKEMNLDSKVLVEICSKAGIPGKGSALASLSDEEVTKVKDFLSNKEKPARKPAKPEKKADSAEPAVLRREDYIAPGSTSGKMPVLESRKKKREAEEDEQEQQREATAEPSVEQPAPTPAAEQPARDLAAGEAEAEQPVAEKDQSEAAPTEQAPAAEVAPREAAAPAKPTPAEPRIPERPPIDIRNIDRKPPVLRTSSEGKGKKRDEETGGKPTGRPSPAIHLAPVPAAEQPKAKKESKSAEPAPQKPDIRLPADAIRSAKAGGARPLAAHIRRVEKEKEMQVESKRPRPAQAEREAGAGTETPTKGKRGRGKKFEEADRMLLGGREQRQLSRSRRPRRSDQEEEGTSPGTRRKLRRRAKPQRTTAVRKTKVAITLPCTIRSFSEATGISVADIQKVLLREGTMVPVTAFLDPDLAEFIAEEMEVEVDFKQQRSLEDEMLKSVIEQVDAEEDLVARPPVITFLGHVDHGKTSLLDRILGINVASGESGGITQHIRAYQIEKDDSKIAFVDTPGHEAFTEMRARGANVTDIAVLVVAADDGVMPQTEEAISHAKAAEVPIVVALNKIDLPGVDENKALQGLAANELLPAQWGGDVEVVKTSAITGEGLDDLLDTVLTVAELHEYKANPHRKAFGTCLEAHQEPGRGVVAKLMVQNGSLKVGDVVVCGHGYGRVKAMYDTLRANERIEVAGPSMPVNMTGLDVAPEAGQHFYRLDDIGQAREIAMQRATTSRSELLGGTQQHVTLETLFDRLSTDGEVSTLNLILRADVRGSIEAIKKELTKLEHAEVKIRILQATVGGITEADVHLADASDAIIIGFNVVPEEGARSLADKRGVQIRRYDVIYKVTEELKAALEGMLKPEEREVELGRTLVQQVFTISRLGAIAGCRVLAGTVERNCRVRIIRNNTIIGDYPLESLRREKEDVREVREGMECGMKLRGFNDVKEGDILEAYRVEEVGRTLNI